ncbi:hypothetical protein QQ045_029055 [Rhodiola kirilowii]
MKCLLTEWRCDAPSSNLLDLKLMTTVYMVFSLKYGVEDEVETEGGQVDTDEVGAGHVRGGWMQSVHGFQVDDVMCDITMCWRVEEVSYIV